MSDRTKGLTLAILGPALWGIMGIFIRPLYVAGITRLDITFVRCLIGGLLYMGLMLITNPSVLRVNGRGLIICMLYGVCSYGIGFVSYSIAITRISVAIATVLMFTAPVWVTVLNIIIFRDRPEKSKVLAILLCFIGAVLAADIIHANIGGSLDPLGIIMSLVNSLGMATQLIIPRFFNGKYEKDTMIAYGFLGTALACMLGTKWSHFSVIFTDSGVDWKLIVCLLGMGVLCTFVSNGSYVKASEYIDTVSVSILSAVEVVVGVIVSFAVFHESMTVLQGIGAVIIMFGALYPNLKVKFEELRGTSTQL
ncbi:MAG: DMT family transporter [Prevotellaceae bacterium]|nr:DMT family transporter [Prevotellaceae bacterium]